jgi:superfamily II DNA or RNA helicase/predicted house-cleaning noncanonical NTP pyrophosphatase (MazG superfamily)/HKD family nuclease
MRDLSMSRDDLVVYRKLVRDRIPEIIRQSGKEPFIRHLEEKSFQSALGRKILEEAYELFAQWQRKNPERVLTESADILELLLETLNALGFGFEDLLRVKNERHRDQGGFGQRLFLESVGRRLDRIGGWDDPMVFFAPGQNQDLIDLVHQEFGRSRSAFIASAFFTPGVINLFLSAFERFLGQGGVLRILLSTMGNVTRPEYLQHLRNQVPGADLKVFHPPGIPFEQTPPEFHVKAFLFERRDGTGSMIIGSSNLTQAAFTRNVEWNYFTSGEINVPFGDNPPFEILRQEFERCFAYEAVPISEDFLEGYRKRWEKVRSLFGLMPWAWQEEPQVAEAAEREGVWQTSEVRPNQAQREALERLADLRRQGVQKAAVVAATGVGKTYLAAFDFKAFAGRRLLFIAHRQSVLSAALNSFRKALGNSEFRDILGGGRELNPEESAVFAMIQTLSREDVLHRFPRDNFDYLVLDEFHHAEASSYQRVIEYFQPGFFLGLTATPERMDGRDVLAICDYQIGYEVRLLEAVDRGWLCPFQYYAIHDETDYSHISWRGTGYDEVELEKALSTDNRTAVVAKNLKRFLPAKGKIKALAFCSSVNHARYTAKHLTQDFGIPSVALVGLSTEVERLDAMVHLESESDPLQVICSVDIFNEGVDIPNVTHVLFLRPTQSFTIFLQQLGRGLRQVPGKEFLVAIDFVGNFRRAHVAPLALAGYTSVEHFAAGIDKIGRLDVRRALPRGCYLSPDLAVERIWEDEIRSIISGRLSPSERLRIFYQEIRESLGGRSPCLMDLYASGTDVDPMAFIRHFGNWIRSKKYCEGGLPPFEEGLLDTAGEAFLQHLERELNPVRSYKMVVLTVLLRLPGGEWSIEEIARGFLAYFLSNRDYIPDYPDLARASDLDRFPLSRVIAKLKEMPLHFLSNTEHDFFVLDSERSRFRIKEDVLPFWQKNAFKDLVQDRVRFALVRYFRRNKEMQRGGQTSQESESKDLSLDS